MIRDKYSISKLDHRTAMGLVVEKHYLHRKAPCSSAFALFDRRTGVIVGVICYGTPFSSTLRIGICGPEEKDNVIELVRLWLDDGVPRNGESFLIGNTLGSLGKEIVVSYADDSVGHIGIVYQATNWMYTGLSAKRTNWTVDGVSSHSQTISDKYHKRAEMEKVFGDRFYLKPRPRKHRYIFFSCDRRRKRELLAKLRYPILPYPKNGHYESNT